MHPVFLFYRPFFLIATFFSLFTCFLLLQWGTTYYVLSLFWVKAFSSTLIGGVFHISRPGQLHFYHNLGFSTIRLYALTAGLDVVIWMAVLFVTTQFL